MMDVAVVALGSALLGALAGSWLSHASSRAVERQQYLRSLYARWFARAQELLGAARAYAISVDVYIAAHNQPVADHLLEQLVQEWDELRDRGRSFGILLSEVRLVASFEAQIATMQMHSAPRTMDTPWSYIRDRQAARGAAEVWDDVERSMLAAIKDLETAAEHELARDPLVEQWRHTWRRRRLAARRWKTRLRDRLPDAGRGRRRS